VRLLLNASWSVPRKLANIHTWPSPAPSRGSLQRKIVCDLRRRIRIGRAHFRRFSPRAREPFREPGCHALYRVEFKVPVDDLRRDETLRRGVFVTRSKSASSSRWRSMKGGARDRGEEQPVALLGRRESHACEWPTCDRRSSVSTSLEPKVRDCGRSGTQSGT